MPSFGLQGAECNPRFNNQYSSNTIVTKIYTLTSQNTQINCAIITNTQVEQYRYINHDDCCCIRSRISASIVAFRIARQSSSTSSGRAKYTIYGPIVDIGRCLNAFFFVNLSLFRYESTNVYILI